MITFVNLRNKDKKEELFTFEEFLKHFEDPKNFTEHDKIVFNKRLEENHKKVLFDLKIYSFTDEGYKQLKEHYKGSAEQYIADMKKILQQRRDERGTLLRP